VNSFRRVVRRKVHQGLDRGEGCERGAKAAITVVRAERAEENYWSHQQNVKTSPGPPRGVMVPLVLLVHLDPPWSTFSVKFQKVWIRKDRSGPGGPQGPQPPLVDQERSGPPWTTLRHFLMQVGWGRGFPGEVGPASS